MSIDTRSNDPYIENTKGRKTPDVIAMLEFPGVICEKIH